MIRMWNYLKSISKPKQELTCGSCRKPFDDGVIVAYNPHHGFFHEGYCTLFGAHGKNATLRLRSDARPEEEVKREDIAYFDALTIEEARRIYDNRRLSQIQPPTLRKKIAAIFS